MCAFATKQNQGTYGENAKLRELPLFPFQILHTQFQEWHDTSKFEEVTIDKKKMHQLITTKKMRNNCRPLCGVHTATK
ncbi:hypothetical protein WUBG_04799 [Wuchereria bancrofti]|uniref:Uncharacterized protein n=1 Tax=Wuchereria bancrofti TaxID=6293 RepID=J9FAA9_WUCBA|nr:hypothetical protein WUBG_04799 [Wuchereria bancrofti]